MDWLYWQAWIVSLVWLWFIYRSVWKTNERLEEGEFARGWPDLRIALVLAPAGTVGAMIMFFSPVAKHIRSPLTVFTVLVVIGLALTINSTRWYYRTRPQLPRREHGH